MGRPRQLLRTAQAEVQGNGFREATVQFGAWGGEFAWVVPFARGGKAYLRVGAAGGAAPGRHKFKYDLVYIRRQGVWLDLKHRGRKV